MLTPFDQAVQDIVAAGQWLDARGLAPATSGNYSVRLPDNKLAVTVSGKHKGKLKKNDVMIMDGEGKPLEDKKPSDESALHVQIYKLYPEARAILHCHSVPGTVVPRLNGGGDVTLAGNEMLKVLPGNKTHETSVTIPVVENSQDMNALSKALAPKLKPGLHAYIIREHGFYVWGRDMAEAERIAEGLEYLLSCEMETMKIKAGVKA